MTDLCNVRTFLFKELASGLFEVLNRAQRTGFERASRNLLDLRPDLLILFSAAGLYYLAELVEEFTVLTAKIIKVMTTVRLKSKR